MEDILGAWVQFGFVIIYVFLDFVINERHKKTHALLKILLILSAIAYIAIQHLTIKANHTQAIKDREQTERERQELQGTIGRLTRQVGDSNDQIVRLTRARQDDIQALNLQFAQQRAADAARRSKTDIVQPAVDTSTPLPVLKQQLADYIRKKAEAQRAGQEAAQEAAAAAAAANSAKQSQEDQKYTADIAHVFYFSLSRLQDLIITEAATNNYSVTTNRAVLAQAKPSPQTVTEITMFLPQVPLNLVHGKEEGSIQFSRKALWKIRLGFVEEYEGAPTLIIDFTDSEGKNSGKFTFYTWQESGNKLVDSKPVDRMHIDYNETIPVTPSSTFTGDHDLADYESILNRALTAIVRIQMAQSMSFTNTPAEPSKK
jgi:hypothetical protein